METITKFPSPLTPAQIEFFSQDQLIDIIPNFSQPTLSLIGGDYGPFEPLTPTTVPIWLALSLEKRKKCKILTPSWMNLKDLREKLELELEDNKTLQPIPFHHMEIALVLLEKSNQSIENAKEIRTVLENFWSRRADKVHGAAPTPDKLAFKFDKNMSAMEINKLRTFFTESMNQFDSVLREKE